MIINGFLLSEIKKLKPTKWIDVVIGQFSKSVAHPEVQPTELEAYECIKACPTISDKHKAAIKGILAGTHYVSRNPPSGEARKKREKKIA